MLLQDFPSGPFETNAYVIACDVTKSAAVVDPAPDSFQAITNYLTKNHLKLVAVWLTHTHWDHIADVPKFKDKYQVPVYVHKLDAPNLERPGSDGLMPEFFLMMKGASQGVKPDRFINDGDTLALGSITFVVMHTPGHSPGSVCLYCKELNVLMSGDTLFKGSIGNLSFPTSQPDLMWPSLQKLNTLPKETKVYPGHGASTTIGNESWLARAKQIFG